MLVTKEWSDPRLIEFGKNIHAKSSHGNFSYKIFMANGRSVERIIHDRVHTIDADDELLRPIRFPMISFRANTNDELHVDFQII